jgi:LMBR1 domain-containing protein 1
VLCNVIVTLFIIGALVLCTFPFFCKAHLPVTQYECKYDHWLAGDEPEGRKVCNRGEDSHLPIVVGFDVYVIACMTFWGWFLFVVFGGIGLASFPLDLILGFIERPQPIDEATYQQRKRIILTATQTLLGKSQELQDRDGNLSMERGFGPSRRKRILKAEYNKFKRDVVLLEEEHEKIKIAKFQRGENPVVAYVKLIVGILAAILSLAWVFHILLYICARLWTPAKKPITPMLNLLFSGLEGWLFPLGVAFFAVFVLYLLLCVVKGCLKFGMRFFFFVSIHPMKYQATPLNSILFNVEMVLLSSAPVVQFSLAAFADYARLTDAVVIFDGQIKYLTFYRWFFEHNVFIYALLLCFLLALIYLLIKPNDDGEVRFDVRTDKKLQSLAGVKKEDMQKKIGGKKKKKKGEKSPRV